MKILMINVVCGIRSTGRICTDLAAVLESQGHEVKIAYGRENVPEQFQKYAVRIGAELDVKLHGLKARLLDGAGFGSKRATEKFIEWVKEYNPDVIHLHNIHGYYINVEVLFAYLKSCGKKIVWTLHDCWAFTGHCVYCQMDQCEKWKDGCSDCPVHKTEYPISFTDKSKSNWEKKKDIFSGIKDVTLITPSEWLANKVRKSYMSEYPVTVINNGIDTSIFMPIDSDVKDRNGIADKKVVLSVASVWDRRKGLDDLIKISKEMPEQYKAVLIGLTDEQIDGLPDNVLGIQKTNSPCELAEWYSAADVFVNPTYEDNYPTTNLEAIACGTPVITYKTGGSVESADLFGVVVEKGNTGGIIDHILNGKWPKTASTDLSISKMCERYLDIYENCSSLYV